ncbi:unnamed protein product, partial [Urochloa humidicola]
ERATAAWPSYDGGGVVGLTNGVVAQALRGEHGQPGARVRVA